MTEFEIKQLKDLEMWLSKASESVNNLETLQRKYRCFYWLISDILINMQIEVVKLMEEAADGQD